MKTSNKMEMKKYAIQKPKIVYFHWLIQSEVKLCINMTTKGNDCKYLWSFATSKYLQMFKENRKQY